MSRPSIRIHDISTDEIIDREMTVAEFNAYKAEQAVSATNEAEAEAKATARQAIADRLGLTADELKLLLG
jgi:hypothetical protein